MLRRRIRKHFKQALAKKAAIEDSEVVAQLSPELRDDTVFFIMDDHVRTNAMFRKIPNSALASILRILHKNHNYAAECIVKEGDPGIAMYILVEGTAQYAKGCKWMPESLGTRRATVPPAQTPELTPGSSFGEEILYGLEERYTYTVVSQTDCDFHIISEDDFENHFRNMPDLRDHMLANFLHSRGVRSDLTDRWVH
jgi:CRP-like cAMP-binding protein